MKVHILIGETAIGTTIPDLPAKEKLYMQTLARITTELNTTNTTETSKPAEQNNKKQRKVLQLPEIVYSLIQLFPMFMCYVLFATA